MRGAEDTGAVCRAGPGDATGVVAQLQREEVNRTGRPGVSLLDDPAPPGEGRGVR